jgi:hypothetical protein
MNGPMLSTYEPGASGILERPRYFPRQLITPVDMTLEQTYFRDKLRRHNRLLHGWGVVCGAQVCLLPKADKTGAEPWKLRVEPGYLLGPYGDEIVIETERTVDLRLGGVVSRSGDPAGELVDPWCSSVSVKQLPETVYVAVRYKELMTRPVRAQPVGCGCDDTQCEYSRWCDGYEIGVLTRCPDSQMPSAVPPAFGDLTKGGLFDCPPCPSDPWVVLAAVTHANDGTINHIDNCSCRRMVISFANFWWRCEGGGVKISKVMVRRPRGAVIPEGEVAPGQTVTIEVTGENFVSEENVKLTVSLGSGVNVDKDTIKVTNNRGTLQFTVTIDPNATEGPRTMTITNPDCSMASMPEAIRIKNT